MRPLHVMFLFVGAPIVIAGAQFIYAKVRISVDWAAVLRADTDLTWQRGTAGPFTMVVRTGDTHEVLLESTQYVHFLDVFCQRDAVYSERVGHHIAPARARWVEAAEEDAADI